VSPPAPGVQPPAVSPPVTGLPATGNSPWTTALLALMALSGGMLLVRFSRRTS
jgi:LPXTG-motif cell wall-anchored protein